MKYVYKVLYFIVNPFSTFGLGKSSDEIANFFNKKNFLTYIVAFVVTALIIFYKYFIQK